LIAGLPLARYTPVGFIVRPALIFYPLGGFKVKTFLAVVILASGFNAVAQEAASSKAKASELSTKQEAQKEDIDKQITNAKLRAESGSKSKHSTSVSANYSGGTMDDAFGKNRPNIAQNSTAESLTSLTGDMKYRYRMAAGDSLTAGVGLKWIAPGHDLDKRQSDAISKQEAANPVVGYTKAVKVGTFQNVLNASVTKITSSEIIDSSQMNGYLYGSHTALTEIGTSGWQLGMSTSVVYYNYNKYIAGLNRQSGKRESVQTEYEVGFYPIAEYVFNDRYNFRTVFRGNTYTSRRDSNMIFNQSEMTQSMGLGIAATRDIFLYPNVQFVWRDVTAEKTNVALSATMNFL
jgi:hypothetical protein